MKIILIVLANNDNSQSFTGIFTVNTLIQMSPKTADVMQMPIFLWEIAWLSLHIPSSPNAIKWYFLQKAIYSSYAPYNTLFIIQEN